MPLRLRNWIDCHSSRPKDVTVESALDMTPGKSFSAGPPAGLPTQQALRIPGVATTVLSRGPIQTIGLYFLLIYLFAVFGLLTEISTNIFGFKPYVSLIMGPLAILATLLSGRALRLLQSRTGIYILLFLFWLLVAAPFSTWRSGTLDTLIDTFLRSYSVAFMIAALAVTIEDFRKVLYVLTAAGISVFLISWSYGVVGSDGRFVLSFGSLMNPNDFATHMLVAISLCALAAVTTKHTWSMRPLLVIAAILMINIVLKTASRATLISLIVMGLLLLVKAPGMQRLVAAFVLIVAIFLSVLVVPAHVWSRFETVYSDDAQGDIAYGVSSRESRKQLLIRAGWTSLTHPLVGVGPGTFIAYEAKVDQLGDRRPAWMGTHNSYLEVSSEAGIPALIFFVGAIASAIRTCLRLYRASQPYPGLKEISSTSLFLFIALVGMAFNIFFSHIAYRAYLPTLLGLTVSFSLAAERKIEAFTSAQRESAAARPPLSTASAVSLRRLHP